VALCIAFLANGAIEDHRLRKAGWEPRYIYRTFTVSEKLFAAVNLPALCITGLFDPSGNGVDPRDGGGVALAIAESFALVAAVGALWFAVGRRLDRVVGWLPSPQWRGNKASMFFSAVGMIVSLALVVRLLSVGAATYLSIGACFWSFLVCCAFAISHLPRMA
jgi:hypothetical protein